MRITPGRATTPLILCGVHVSTRKIPVCVSLPRNQCIYTWANICGSTRTGSYATNDVRRPTAHEYRSRLCIRMFKYSGRKEGDRRLPLTFTDYASRSVVRYFYLCYKHFLIRSFTNRYFFSVTCSVREIT